MLTAYCNFDQSAWAGPNLACAVQNWKRDPCVHVTVVELARNGCEFELTEEDLTCDCLLQLRVRDVMVYDEVALNIALARVPESCTHVAWIEPDAVFVNEAFASRWASSAADVVEAACGGPKGACLRQLCAVQYQTSERGRSRVLERVAAGETWDAACRAGLRGSVRSAGALANATSRSPSGAVLHGTAWIAPSAFMKQVRFFRHAVAGGGTALMVHIMKAQGAYRQTTALACPSCRYMLDGDVNRAYQPVVREYAKRVMQVVQRLMKRGGMRRRHELVAVVARGGGNNKAVAEGAMLKLYGGIARSSGAGVLQRVKFTADDLVYGRLDEPLLPVFGAAVLQRSGGRLSAWMLEQQARCAYATHDELLWAQNTRQALVRICKQLRTLVAAEGEEAMKRSRNAETRRLDLLGDLKAIREQASACMRSGSTSL